MFRKIGANFDGDVTVGWWSKFAKTIFFNEGIKATEQLCAVDVPSGEVRQLTREKASLRAAQDPESGRLTISFLQPRQRRRRPAIQRRSPCRLPSPCRRSGHSSIRSSPRQTAWTER